MGGRGTISTRQAALIRAGMLPTIDQVVRETGLSPMTIRRAVKVLAAEGLVEVVPGRGSFVIDHSR
jgi:DNA-binding GntR family transcriptional regulator